MATQDRPAITNLETLRQLIAEARANMPAEDAIDLRMYRVPGVGTTALTVKQEDR